jgi:diacylglycerol kinase family enzyme
MAKATGGHLLDGIDRILVIRNERSTRSDLGASLVSQLRETLPKKEIVELRTGTDDTATNRRKLVEHLKGAAAGRTLLVAAGGDGTAHFVAAALLHADTPARCRQNPITPWPLGNGNDFFNSVHGTWVARDPLKALTSPKVHAITVHPLEWRIQTERGERRRFSLCYGTIGATGSATEYINRPGHRKRRKQLGFVGRLLLDIRQVVKALWFPHQFTVRHKGESYRATELQFNNGPIMTMRARYPVLLSERRMFVSTSHSRHPLAIAMAALRMGAGKLPGAHHKEHMAYQLLSDRPIYAQSDGDAFKLPQQVKFTVGPSAMSLTVWATRGDS